MATYHSSKARNRCDWNVAWTNLYGVERHRLSARHGVRKEKRLIVRKGLNRMRQLALSDAIEEVPKRSLWLQDDAVVGCLDAAEVEKSFGAGGNFRVLAEAPNGHAGA